MTHFISQKLTYNLQIIRKLLIENNLVCYIIKIRTKSGVQLTKIYGVVYFKKASY